MRYLLSCPCGHKIPVSRSQAGSQLPCPICGQTLEVPTIRGLANLPLEQQPPAEGTVGKRTAPRWSIARRVAAAVCFCVALIGFIIGGMLLIVRLSLDTGWTLEGELEYGDAMIAQYEPAELWDAWASFRQEGLGPKNPPPHVIMQRDLQARDPYLYGAFGFATAGLIGWLLTIFTAPRASREKG